jgi:hypothetical protein
MALSGENASLAMTLKKTTARLAAPRDVPRYPFSNIIYDGLS